ncbi:hypothetical protein BN1013_02248 [Candidatus Rubidus massiliensis]|nr:hypothetical protein BN1013_02248 [Candidatus Rubidus massiliensis]
MNLSPDVVDTICCPITLAPFQEAQMVNCEGNHSFSLEAITPIFGKIINGNCEKQAPCPICRGSVSLYRYNRSLQDIVDAILGKSKGNVHFNQMFETVKKLKLDFSKGELYPLEKSFFKLNRSYFSDNYVDINFEVKSCENKKIHIFSCSIEYINAKPRYHVCIFLNDKDEQSKKDLLRFLQNNSIDFLEVHSFYTALTCFGKKDILEKLLSLLRLIILNNEFDEESSIAIKKFIKKCETINQD